MEVHSSRNAPSANNLDIRIVRFPHLRSHKLYLQHVGVTPLHHCLTEQFIKARVAIRFLVLFFECPLVQWAKTERTDEMFRVVLSVHCRHTPAFDRLTARSAWHSVVCEKVPLAVHCTIQFVKPGTIKWQTTFLNQKNTTWSYILRGKEILALTHKIFTCTTFFPQTPRCARAVILSFWALQTIFLLTYLLACNLYIY